MSIRGALIALTLVVRLQASGQTASQELLFAKHLIAKKNYEEAIYLLKNVGTSPSLAPLQNDSVHFFLGNIYYTQQQLPESITHFDLVSGLSKRMKSEALFFSAFNNAYLKKYSVAKQKLLTYTPVDSGEHQVRNLELAGISLLQRDLKNFDSLSKSFDATNYSIDQQEKKMNEHRDRILGQPKKSPLLAASLSGILPGAGKFYAGNKGQGIYTLLISTVLGLQAWEGYHKDGPSSARFIIYSTLFTSLYIGTIWGSAFSVKLKRDQLNETINNQILFDMHIPLRTLFH
ncbi:MAG: hypothetical protein JST48_05350 [Bacteroidetes bacterium]|nr:hypothetical protein [Bacteroidota bacterium]